MSVIGSLKLIIGPMYASKSSSMIHDIDRYRLAGRKCVIIKHAIDTRYDHLATSGTASIITHDMLERSHIKIICTDRLIDVDINEYDVLGVSEVQFFSDMLLLDEWATAGKIIIAEGLDGDFNRDNFGELHKLLPKCEKVTKLQAVCVNCGADASFTKKILGDLTKIVDVGTKDKYAPTCRKCYNMETY